MSINIHRRALLISSAIGAVVAESRDQDVTFMAGSIAYYAFLSLVPSFLLLFVGVATIGDERLAAFVAETTEAYLTPTAQTVLINTLRETGGKVKLSALAIGTLLWGVTGVFRGLDTAFSKLYGTDDEDSLVDTLVDAIVVLTAMTVATFSMFVATTISAVFPVVPSLGLLNFVFLTGALVVLFFPIYYVFPDTDVSVGSVLPGTVVAAVGWTTLQMGFQIYVSLSSKPELYGVLGGVLLVLTWLYFGALVILVGAATNVVIADRLSSVASTSRTGRL